MHVTGWLGDNDDLRSTAKRAIAVAQELGRKDLEALVTQALAQNYLLELDAEQAEPLVQRPSISAAGQRQRRRPRARGSSRSDARLDPRRREAAHAPATTRRARSTTEIGATSLEATLKAAHSPAC